MNRLRIATRGSRLALAQTKIVADKLAALGIASEPLVVLTKGDRDTQSPLPAIGGNGLFVRGIEEVLLSGQADIAVHSAKDLPYDLAEGLLIGGIPQAQDPRERLLTRREQLPPGPRIGTDSPRRREAFRRLCPDVFFCSLRGNVPTRVEKLRRGNTTASFWPRLVFFVWGWIFRDCMDGCWKLKSCCPRPARVFWPWNAGHRTRRRGNFLSA